jgi:multiple sugar transport system substrate-binding protein
MKTLRNLLIVIIYCLLAIGIVSSDSLAANFDWTKYKGTALRFIMHKMPPTDDVLKMIPDFEKKTGIKVDAEVLPEEQFRQKLLIEFASGKSSVDVFLTLPANDGLKYLESGWYEPLEGYLKDPSKTEQGFDFNDFTKGAQEGAKMKGVLICMPQGISTHLVYFRKDLFDKYDVKVPETLEELEAAAKKLTRDTDGDGKTDVYGWANRGKGRVATSTFSMFLLGFGGRFLDANGNPAINSPEAIKALDYYGRLLREYGPPGSTNFNFYEVNSYFSQGKVAMVTAGVSTYNQFNDPKKSAVVGKIGYSLMPDGPGGRHPFSVVWGFSIYSGSKNKDASWLLIQYLTNKEAMRVVWKHGGSRVSTWKDPEVVKSLDPKSLYEIGLESDKVGNPHWNPQATSVTELRDALGNTIVSSILGEDVRKAADKAQAEWVKILEKERRQ